MRNIDLIQIYENRRLKLLAIRDNSENVLESYLLNQLNGAIFEIEGILKILNIIEEKKSKLMLSKPEVVGLTI